MRHGNRYWSAQQSTPRFASRGRPSPRAVKLEGIYFERTITAECFEKLRITKESAYGRRFEMLALAPSPINVADYADKHISRKYCSPRVSLPIFRNVWCCTAHGNAKAVTICNAKAPSFELVVVASQGLAYADGKPLPVQSRLANLALRQQ